MGKNIAVNKSDKDLNEHKKLEKFIRENSNKIKSIKFIRS